MKRAVLEAPEKIVFQEVDKAVPQKGEVLIKVRRMGICGSDIHAFHGQHPTMSCPVVMGHEFSGEIAELGEGAGKLQIGDAVTVRPQITCGECYHCKTGNENVCHELKVIGCNEHAPGGAQEYALVPEHLVFALPEGMSFDDGAMIEPVAVGVAAVKTFAMDVKGKKILVLGAGTIGNLVAQSAKAMGAASVTITDICDEKLEIARRCGIDHTINTKTENLEERLKAFYGKDGLDGALECVGSEITVNEAIKVCRKETEIIIVGIYAKDPAVHMIDVQEKELHLSGVLMYSEEEFVQAMKFIQEGAVDLEPLKTKHFPFEAYGEAYRYIGEHPATSMKILIDIAE